MLRPALSCAPWLAVLVIACGPPKQSSDAEPMSTQEVGTSDDPPETTEPPESEDDESDTGEGNTGMTFVPETDLSNCAYCDVFAQDVPEGEKCVAYSCDHGLWGGSKPMPVSGDKAAGESCSYDGPVNAGDDCDGDSACWELHEVDGQWLGVCRSFCSGNYDNPICPDQADHCFIGYSGHVALCVRSCDPLMQDCAPGSSCVYVSDDFQCIFSAGQAASGEPCEQINGCAPGLHCAAGEQVPGCAEDCCTPYCDLNLGEAACEAAPGTVCTPFFEQDPLPMTETLGLCLLP